MGARRCPRRLTADPEGVHNAVQSAECGEFVSVGLHRPDEAEMVRVAEIFGLHRPAVEDSLA